MTEDAQARVGQSDGFRFCANPSCDVAYFHPETKARIARDEVRVRIGQKETEPPRPVCYCFDHTVEEAEDEVAETGASRIADGIAEKCRRGLDRCEETNPQGSCCLGNVRQAVRDAQAKHAAMASAVAAGTGTREAASCCLSGDAANELAGPPRNTGLWATAGAVVSAILSSACCWLPLLLIAFGASTAGVSGFLEVYRPYLLGATGLLLAGGFYLVYFRQERCGPDGTCAARSPGFKRFNKTMLWAATVVVLGFAFFPNYVGYLLGNGDPHVVATPPASGESRMFRVEGMTCEACAVTLRGRLGKLPGVAHADVSFANKTARVSFAEGHSRPPDEKLLGAIRDAGYSGASVESK